ncbi:MAG: hypothetical protein P4L43_16465 [Syntrophobacteraceae bacterium]|nr:hypothetical protein [Syntrophobacteraceae bacterium]
MKRVVAAAFSVFLLAVVAYAGPYGASGSGGAVSHNQSAASDWRFGALNVGNNLSGSTETPVAQWYCTDSASNTIMCGEITLQMTNNTSGSLTTVLRRYDLVSGTVTNLDAASSQTLASGTATLGTSAISSGACAAAVTVAATGVLSTDAISWSFNAAPPSGYNGTGGILDIRPFVTGGNVNFLVCNSTASSITPGAATLNWRVLR